MKRLISIFLAIIMIFGSIAFGAEMEDTVSYVKDSDLEEWGILSLYSIGKDVSDIKLDKIDSKVTTDYEAYILGAIPMDKDISSEVKKILNVQKEDGKFADFIDGSGNDLVNAHVWGVISLYVAGEDDYNKEKALEWLKNSQNTDGGFPIYTGDNMSDLDMTAMSIIALNILGLDKDDKEIQQAIEYMNNNLDKRENCESIAWYILAKVKLGIDVEKPLYDRLMKYRMDDGSFKHIKAISRGNYMATWHGLMAMSDYQKGYSIFAQLHNENRFTDLKKENYAYKEIMTLINKGVVSGYLDNTFKPNNNVKRAEFAKFLIYGLRMDDKIGAKTKEFKDLNGHWANNIVALAVKKDLIKGMSKGKFAPNDNITGAQVATILVRAKGLNSEVSTVDGSSWYQGYVKVAKDNDLLYDNFNPNAPVTRAQCAEAIYNIMK